MEDDSSEECGESGSEASDGSLYIPTPERTSASRIMGNVSPIALPNEVGFIELPQLSRFLNTMNTIRRCTTPGCKGNVVPIAVKSRGLGGGISVSCVCDGCAVKGAVFETHSKHMNQLGNTNNISMCVQVAFIVAGCTHAMYYKTLKHALGIQAVSAPLFMGTIENMYPIVKSMLDEVCEAAKQEMKEKKEEELGSWKRAVTTADGTWQTRGFHSKNATFTIRNYLNGALLYYHHLCQKGRDKIIEEELYKGTSKSAEGYAARDTFKRAKQEGMQVAVHWQDADSSSAKAVTEVFPDAEIMICGGHAGRAHKKILESRQKMKSFSKHMLDKYKERYPALSDLSCKCKGKHNAACGCLTGAFIAKAHTNFTSILMEAQSQEEFVQRVEALPKHARDIHEWEGGRCDFHPLRVCTCKQCENKEQITCEGKPYKAKRKLECEFHALVYEIECKERASQAGKLVHPILKRGHSNAVEASHNVLIRFRSKDISLERLHYHLSTNLGLLQANMTYMHAKLGTSYHWIPELYRRMKLPVFEGVVEALEEHSVRRKRQLEMAKMTPEKKRRIALKKKRVYEGIERIKWSKKHGRDTYGDSGASDLEEGDPGSGVKQGKGKRKGNNQDRGKPKCAACGSSTHQRSSHKDCPFNQYKDGSAHAKKKGNRSETAISLHKGGTDADRLSSVSVSSDAFSDVSCLDDSLSDVRSLGDDDSLVIMCTCGAKGRAHKRGCPMNSWTRYPGHSPRGVVSVGSPVPSACEDVLEPVVSKSSDLNPPSPKRSKMRAKIGDYVCIHSSRLGECHVPCRVVRDFGSQYQLYCSKGVLNTSFSGTELIPLTSCASIPLDKWRQAPKVSLRSIASDPAVIQHCDCNVPMFSESIVVSSASEGEDTGHNMWVKNELYSLTHNDQKVVTSRSGWLTDEVISAAQMIMLQYFPSMSGLQPPTLQKVFAFQVHSGEFVQIIHIRNNHWCVVSTVGCESGVVNVYDSLYTSVSDKTIHLIASMVSSSSSKLEIRMMDVAKQLNSSDCGVLAIAYAFDICNRLNPCEVQFEHKKIRQHLAQCLETCQLSRFPILCGRKCASIKSTKTVDLHCTCRMPEETGDEMAECDLCHVWYHRHCMDIPNEVFGDSDVFWKCKICCDRDC